MLEKKTSRSTDLWQSPSPFIEFYSEKMKSDIISFIKLDSLGILKAWNPFSHTLLRSVRVSPSISSKDRNILTVSMSSRAISFEISKVFRIFAKWHKLQINNSGITKGYFESNHCKRVPREFILSLCHVRAFDMLACLHMLENASNKFYFPAALPLRKIQNCFSVIVFGNQVAICFFQ